MLLIVMSPAGLSLKEPFGEKFGGGWQARSRSLLPPIDILTRPLSTPLARPRHSPTALRAAAAQVLTKPVTSRQLLHCLKEALSDDHTNLYGLNERSPQPQPLQAMRLGGTPLEQYCRHAALDNGATARVLIADDHPVNQKLVRWILQSDGIECDIVNNGLDAVRMIEAAALDYDVVLMDINMPIMTGSEAAEQIRRLEASGDLCQTTRCHLSIVGMSATDGEQVPKFLDRGMDDFLIFPIDREILLQKVQHWIAHARAEPRPTIDLRLVLDACQGERRAMVNMLREFVHMTLSQAARRGARPLLCASPQPHPAAAAVRATGRRAAPQVASLRDALIRSSSSSCTRAPRRSSAPRASSAPCGSRRPPRRCSASAAIARRPTGSAA